MSQGSFVSGGSTNVSFYTVDTPIAPHLTPRGRTQHTPGKNGANYISIDKVSTDFPLGVTCKAAGTAVWTETTDKADTILYNHVQSAGTLVLHGNTYGSMILNGVDVIENKKAGGSSTVIQHQRLNLFFTRLA